MENKNLDIIVLGATGFTGKCTVKRLASLTMDKYSDVTWGFSGRSKQRILDLLSELNKSGLVKNNIPIMESDVMNEASLKKTLQVAKIVINCTGPNTLLSSLIVKTCIETHTHYIDISAEIFAILKLYQTYHKSSEDAGVLVIPACGFSAIPVETAMIHLDRHFKGTLHTVECYAEIQLPKRAYLPGCSTLVHNGTWTSLVHVLETFKKHLALWSEIFSEPIEPEPEEIKRSFFHRRNGRFWFPYPGFDSDVVDMSQRYLYEKRKKKLAHCKIYTTVPTFIHYLIVPVIFFYFYLSYFKCFRNLLINYPSLFTFGFITKQGPTEKMREDTKYNCHLTGKGWNVGADLTSKPTKTMSVKVSGCDPGYNTTANAIIMGAITILKESSNMPNGGVVTPGAAFYRTDIVVRLMHNGYKFEVVEH